MTIPTTQRGAPPAPPPPALPAVPLTASNDQRPALAVMLALGTTENWNNAGRATFGDKWKGI